jgi:uncharacterized membrane protein
MSEILKPMAKWCASITEGIGFLIITIMALYAVIYSLHRVLKKERAEEIFQMARQHLGRGILLGLEFLVAADIIHTVAVELTFKTIGVLVLIVLIRTFLSFSLEVELTGRWPWENKAK